jgi:Leucine-rich repeat (LRR) protein
MIPPLPASPALSQLFLDNNQLLSLQLQDEVQTGVGINRLTGLTVLTVTANKLEVVTPLLATLPLKLLDLTNNNIQDLPSQLGKVQSLNKVWCERRRGEIG